MGQFVGGSSIDAILHELKENVDRDKAHVQRAIQSLVHMTTRTASRPTTNGADLQDHQELTAHERDVASNGLPVNTDLSTRAARMLTHGNRSTYFGGQRNTSRRPIVVDPMPVPNYGLPGIGEYEERRKQFQQEWKEECQKQMSKHACQPKRRSRNADATAIDYEEILARKRSEERKYRLQNNDPTFVSTSLRPYLSEGNLNTNRSTNGYGPENSAKYPPEARQANGVRYNQGEEDYDRFDGNFRDYAPNKVMGPRPHSYPTEYNGVSVSPPGITHHNGRPRAQDNGFSANDYRRQLDEHRREIVDQRQRELYEQEVEHYYRNNVAQPPVDQRYESSRKHLGSNEGVFIRLDRTERATMPKNQEEHQSNLAADYQADLALQMEQTRQRKRDEKAEEIRSDIRIEEENKQYNPWGRGGGGAPVKDREGKNITVRGQLGNDRARRVSIVTPTVEPAYLQRVPSLDDLPLLAANARAAPPSYAQVQQAGHRLGRALVPATSSIEDYQDDLKRQIEDKRRRELEEKERDRLEEEKLMRRVEEENEKMKLEFEEELKKQKLREQERLRRNEELLERQKEQKKEAERQRREQNEKERLDKWEDRERNLGRDPSPNGGGGRNSPPIRGAHRTNARKMSVAADNAKLLLASAVPQKQPHHEQIQQSAKPGPKRSDAEHVEDSREHILSQLSAMRQQLEIEQKVMLSQMKKEQRDDEYEVLDKKPTASSRNTAPANERRLEKPIPIKYRPPKVDAMKTERRQSVKQPAIESSHALNKAMIGMNRNNGIQRGSMEVQERGGREDEHVPTSHKSYVLWPNNGPPRDPADHAQKTLKGDSFFLAGVESDDVDDQYDDVYNNGRWHSERRNSQGWSVDDDLQADSSAERSLVKRDSLNQGESSDDIQDDSFLDEFMGRNLHRR